MYGTKKQPKTHKPNIKPTPRKLNENNLICKKCNKSFIGQAAYYLHIRKCLNEEYINNKPQLVLLESPYAGKTKKEIDHNVKYAQLCMKDCFNRGEYPFASHLLYTQSYILDDNIPEERQKGIQAGLAWGRHASKTVVYCDYGISKGMMEGIKRADSEGRMVEKRYLYYSSGRIIQNEK